MGRRSWTMLVLPLAASVAGAFLFFSRQSALPRFVTIREHEAHRSQSVRIGLRCSDVYECSVRYPFAEILQIDDLRKNYRWSPRNGWTGGVLLRPIDPQSPIRYIALSPGRYRPTSLSNHSWPPEHYSDGWTGVQISFRPTIQAAARSWWKKSLATALGADRDRQNYVGFVPDPAQLGFAKQLATSRLPPP